MKKIFALIISFFIIFGSILFFIDFMALDISYYNNFHKENNISKTSGLSNEWINDASDSLVLYIKNGDDKVLENHFNKKEISHMKDVYKLFDLNRKVYKSIFVISVLTFIYFMIYKKYKFFNYLKKYLFIAYISILSFFGVCAKFFSESFLYFHRLFFNNDLWLLDYEKDLMIRILPEEFFFNLFINVLILTTIFVMLLYVFINLSVKVDDDF